MADERLVILAEYIDRTGVRVQDVADKIGVTSRTVYNWIGRQNFRVSPLASKRLDSFLRVRKVLDAIEGR